MKVLTKVELHVDVHVLPLISLVYSYNRILFQLLKQIRPRATEPHKSQLPKSQISAHRWILFILGKQITNNCKLQKAVQSMPQVQRTETFLIKHSLTCWQLQTHGQNATILHITEWEKLKQKVGNPH